MIVVCKVLDEWGSKHDQNTCVCLCVCIKFSKNKHIFWKLRKRVCIGELIHGICYTSFSCLTPFGRHVLKPTLGKNSYMQSHMPYLLLFHNQTTYGVYQSHSLCFLLYSGFQNQTLKILYTSWQKSLLLNFILLEFSKVSEGSLILQTSYSTVLLTISILTSFLHKFNT